MSKKPVAIIILDGFGWRNEMMGNAVKLAKKPNFDRYWNNFPHATMLASGLAVGLPEGQMGNSEVGHTNIGAGRVVYQSLTRIDKAIQDGEFLTNEALVGAYDHTTENNSALHLFGLLSDGGVHSHINHVIALIKSAKEKGVKKLYLHAFLDGRDVDPHAAPGYIETVEKAMEEIGLGEIATVSGRYYAMDRDNRWERVELAYNAIAHGEGEKFESAQDVVKASYADGKTDEFVLPTVIVKDGKPVGPLQDNDAIIFFNFRPDRAIQLSNAFTNEEWTNFDRKERATNVKFVTMTSYQDTVIADIAFKPIPMTNVLGEVLAQHNLSQLRIAETEKYPHVTFFMNGGRHEPFEGEGRILIPSPKVATYDLKPEMSAYEVKDKLIAELSKGDTDTVILNFANPDMVGHTGNIEAVIKALTVVDECVGEIVDKVLEMDGAVLITADHGNADLMVDPETGAPFTAHTTNPVPLIVVSNRFKNIKLRNDGKLADITPTMLNMLEVEKPAEMTGESLIIK